MTLKKLYSILFTMLIVVVALAFVRALWLHYMNDPWTRDARVRANVINIAPDVAGLVEKVLVHDNQLVKKGEVLFEVDPARYQLAMQRAVNNVIARKTDVDLRKEEAARRRGANDLVVSRENRSQADSAAKVAEAEYQRALNELEAAKLDLQRTKIRATADGYITNLNLHKGDYIQVGQAAMALIDKDSFWVYGYFEETKLPLVKEGESAEITLMSGEKMHGHVSSIARGIYDSDNPDSQELIANVRPTFDWVRLARRIPVHISLDELPQNQILAMGTTCTVVLNTEHQREWWDIF
ncbi:HlyD family secretion protein [Shewanella avicenniae]|uniref:HlyD family secretion protein n=1 Tax=Shewanella avicenniae TaxID=2814294 RepID=A0ABX7QV56_9GAMM|nr:HlyD family secretion protein [Shewanella avicenniae]QSX34800.1 HlyD family secretion protein [Shewanella avicenniae]